MGEFFHKLGALLPPPALPSKQSKWDDRNRTLGSPWRERGVITGPVHASYPFLTLLLTTLLGGCAATSTEHLPAYHWTDAPAAMAALCGRARAVHCISAESALTLTRPDGQSVRLDGALVMRLPDSVRLRAWKFGQAVFDLTLTPEGLWIESPPDPNRHDEVLPASINAGKMARALSVMFGEFFCGGSVSIYDIGGSRFRVERNIDGQRIVCEVERATLTPRRYSVMDSAGVERFALTIDHYQVIQGIVWPDQLGGHGESGQINIDLKNIELNGELAPTAFVPPRKAEKMR